MAVKLAVDISGSMDDELRSGWVQDTVDLFLAAAMKFDDDGQMEIGFFNTSFKMYPDMTEVDAGTYIKAQGVRANGGTAFGDVIGELNGDNEGGFFSFVKSPAPVYIVMIS